MKTTVRVQLMEHDGRHVSMCDLLLPPMHGLPDGIIWGRRFFKRSKVPPDRPGAAATYSEGLLAVHPGGPVIE